MNEITVGQFFAALTGPHQIEIYATSGGAGWFCRCGDHGTAGSRDLAWTHAAIHVQQEAGKWNH